MTDFKRRSANALPLRSGSAATNERQGSAPSSASSSSKPTPFRQGSPELRKVKLEAKALQEKLQKAVIDNPQAAKKAALLISMWIEGKSRKTKKAG